MKLCKTCKDNKRPEEFYKNPLGSQGLNSSCKECSKSYARFRSKLMQPWKKEGFQAKRKSRMKNWHLQNLYGITLMEFEALLAAQKSLCACCDRPMTRPHVDHDHKTGKVRSLLCGPCNTGIGQFGEDPERCELAAKYLRKHSNL